MSVSFCFTAVDSCLVSSAHQPHMNQAKLDLCGKLRCTKKFLNQCFSCLLLSFKLTNTVEIVMEL